MDVISSRAISQCTGFTHFWLGSRYVLLYHVSLTNTLKKVPGLLFVFPSLPEHENLLCVFRPLSKSYLDP